MNHIIGLLQECSNRRVELSVIEGQLKFRAPKTQMTTELRESLRRHKNTIITLLNGDPFPSEWLEQYSHADLKQLSIMTANGWGTTKKVYKTRGEVVQAVVGNMSDRLDDSEFTRRYMILMRSFRDDVIDEQTRDEGLDFLLECWEASIKQ